MKSGMLFLLVALLVACTPKTADKTDDGTFLNSPTTIDATSSQKVGTIKGEKYTTTMSKNNLVALLNDKFRNVENIDNIEIMHFSGEYYYLTASGNRDKEPVVMAAELTVKDGKDLYLDAYNKLNHLCFGQYCGECAFRFMEDGSINNCTCEEGEKKRPEGMATCGYSRSIATMEKKF